MLREAIEHHRQGRLPEAETAYREALATNSSDSEALRGLAAVRRSRGDLAECIQLVTRAQELAPDQPALLHLLGSVQFEASNINAAREAYERALALDPNLAGAHTALGHIAMMNADNTLAGQHFRTALRVEEDPQALSGLGILALSNADVEGALKYLTRAADLAPNDASIAFNLGRVFAARGMAAFAEQAFRNALRLNPGLPHANNALGQLLIQDKRVAESEPYFRALVGVSGFELAADLGLGDVARMQERYEDAAEAYRHALTIKPDHEPCFEALLWSLGKLERNAEVMKLLDQRIEDFPDQPRWRATRARIRASSARYVEAASDWQALRDREPKNAEAAIELALMRERNGEYELVDQLVEAAVALAPNDPLLTSIRVRSHMRKGEESAARELLATIPLSKINEDLARTCMNLHGQLHDRAGDVDKAVEYFREAQNGLRGMLPKLETLPENIGDALAKPTGDAWKHAPILLIGAPGSGVERIAALLADQADVNVLRDRVQGLRNDCFDAAPVDLSIEETPSADIEAHREAYLGSMRARGLDLDKPLVDWIPRFDAHYLLVAHRIMPGTRVILVDNDPRDALLNWLGFGWLPHAGLNNFDSCVDWMGRALSHLRLAASEGSLPHLVINADKVLADPAKAGAELARFVGIESVQPGNLSQRLERGPGGLPTRFAAGHWQTYSEVLADAFAKLPN
ncbi:MAG TPA: tetratricopeptide repeat protein [Dokdonella sp.]|uniref:tetratricopeptide repeat protein n=1 Tax=Dokdonella sp. TaxID=2291710 RepID=UPI002D7EAC94|nr:tetratricopeptide repeat protein [Dokdonella sp.]HET9033850.1 tetratricopeptide repeat protein [Dokdonella sp.]